MTLSAAADFYLTIQGVRYPLSLRQDENELVQWGEGLAPLLAPQFNDAGFGYENVPPEIEVVEAHEDFSGGCGFDTNPYNVPGRYTYTRGIDLSFARNAIVALKRQALLESDGTAIAAAPVAFFDSTLGLFMLAGAYIYEWDLTTTSWIQRDDATGTFSGAAYKEMVELDSVLYASRGSAADYKYSTDGITWTAFTAADENADYWTLRGNGSDVASIWKMNSNIVKATVDGQNAGTAWSGGDELGNTGETVKGFVTVDNDLFAFKDRGIYQYDGTNTLDLWHPAYFDAANGTQAFLWGDGSIYVVYERRLLRFNPYANNANSPAEGPLSTVFPTQGMDSLEILGLPTAVAGDGNWVYMAVKNHAGNTYVLKGRRGPQGWAWHTIAYLGANDCNALAVIAPTVMHATNPALVLGYGTAAHMILLPRQDIFPHEDANCTYETSEGVAYMPHTTFGPKTYSKFLNRGAVLGTGLTAGRYATLNYEIDRSGTETAIVTAIADGLSAENEDSEVAFYLLRQILRMGTGDETITPRVEGIVLGATPNPPRKRLWAPQIILSNELEFPHGDGADTEAQPAAGVMRRILFAAMTKRLTLTVPKDGSTFTVRLLDIQPGPSKDKRLGGTESEVSGFTLTLVEIKTLSSNETVAVFDESDYDQGHVYGDV